MRNVWLRLRQRCGSWRSHFFYAQKALLTSLLLIFLFPQNIFCEESGAGLFVISANLKKILAENTSASVQIISREQIEKTQANSLPELLKSAQGLDLTNLHSPGDDFDLRMRGSDRDGVLVMMDGVRLNSVSEDRASLLGSFSLEDIERVEIVRGPQSIFYGSRAVGGVINLITRREHHPLETTLKIEGGRFQKFRESLSLSGGNFQTQTQMNFSRHDEKGQGGHDRFGQTSGSFGLHQTLPAGVEIDVGAHIFSSRQDLSYDFLTSFDPQTSSLLIRIAEDEDRELKRTEALGHLRLYATPTSRWKIEGGYAGFLNFTHVQNQPTETAAPAGYTLGSQNYHGTEIRHTLDLRNFIAAYDSKNFSYDLTVGGEFEDENFHFTDPPSVYPAEGQDNRRQNYAVFLENNLSFLNHTLLFSAGGRLDHNSTFGNALSPRVSLLYKLQKTGTTVRANYGAGFHGPTLRDFYNTVLLKNLGLPFQAIRLQPELSQSYEGGVLQKIGKSTEVSANVYYTRFHRLFDELSYIDRAHVWGVESGIVIEPDTWWTASGSYSFLKGVNEDRHIPLDHRPSHTGKFSISTNPHKNFRIQLDGTLSSSRLIPHLLSTAQGDLPITFINQEGIPEGGSLAAAQTEAGRRLGGYTKLDITLQWKMLENEKKLKSLKSYLKIENLLNQHYQEKFGFKAPGTFFTVGMEGKI